MIHKVKEEVPDKFGQRFLIDKNKNKLGLHDVCRCTYNEYQEVPYYGIWAVMKGPYRKYKAERYVLVQDLPHNMSRHEYGRQCIEPSTLNGIVKSRKGGLYDF